MDDAGNVWENLSKFPQLLNEYGKYSYPLLGVLLVVGLSLLGYHLYSRKKSRGGLPGIILFTVVVLCFLALGGFFLKGVGAIQQERALTRFIEEYRAPEGKHWLLVFDFNLPPRLNEEDKARYLGDMQRFVDSISTVLLENLPESFHQPTILRVPVSGSPWQTGVGQNNYDEVIHKLNAFEIMWGSVYSEGTQAQTFLGISNQLVQNFDPVIPLRNFQLGEDPWLDTQFGDGYYRLIGLVTFGMALDTYQQALKANGEERKILFLKAAQQIKDVQNKVIDKRNDEMLGKTVYSNKAEKLYKEALQEAGL